MSWRVRVCRWRPALFGPAVRASAGSGLRWGSAGTLEDGRSRPKERRCWLGSRPSPCPVGWTGTVTERVHGSGPRVVRVALVDAVVGFDVTPDRLVVDPGAHLVLNVVNEGEEVHNLALEHGRRTSRLDPGQSQRLDLGVITSHPWSVVWLSLWTMTERVVGHPGDARFDRRSGGPRRACETNGARPEQERFRRSRWLLVLVHERASRDRPGRRRAWTSSAAGARGASSSTLARLPPDWRFMSRRPALDGGRSRSLAFTVERASAGLEPIR
jgi:hypothetical protein